MRNRFAAVLFVLSPFLMPTLVSAAKLDGDWLSPTQSVVRVYRCGSELCLKVVKLGPNTPLSHDTHNPDTSLRSRPLCGLDIGKGFKEANEARAEGGELYDPESGKTYKGTMAAEGDQLKLRGYVFGIPLLGRTEVWHRISAVVHGCGA